jgi:hypothetical protein
LPKELFDIFDGHPFDGEHCFLCGAALNADNRTVEHVFPRWMQEAFSIRDRTITLLNRTRLAYRSLVIPCCKHCNEVHLSQLENRVRGVVLDESTSLEELSDVDLNAWLSKIYIGILWKELELSFDRRNPDAGPILPRAVMSNFRMLHFFMQSCRKPMTFHGRNNKFPNSLIRVACKFAEGYEHFDYLDNPMAHSIAIRMGSKGIIGIFDGGLHNLVFPNFAREQFDCRSLHPMQFKEVYAKVTYKNLLSARVPFYALLRHEETDEYHVYLTAFDDETMSASLLVAGEENGKIMFAPVLNDGIEEGPAYKEWSQEQYARVLSSYTGIALEKLFRPPDMVLTSLRDDAGNFIDL